MEYLKDEVKLAQKYLYILQNMRKDTETLYQPESNLLFKELPSPVHIAAYTNNFDAMKILLNTSYKYFLDVKDPITGKKPIEMTENLKMKEIIKNNTLKKPVMLRSTDMEYYAHIFPEYFISNR